MTDIRLDNKPLHGRHYETGTLRNAWSLRGAKAPHTGEPYSEALLLGVSGGITFGYFTFAYTGELPHLALLTRNTFDPFETILERLAPAREVRQTADAATAERQLNEALEAGEAPLVWADIFRLPYYGLDHNTPMWMMRPMVVVGRNGGGYWLGDGSRQPWWVSAADLASARGRVKKERFRLMTLEPPNPEKLPAAVRVGLQQCIRLFTEPPPKGARDNFGFAAYDRWAKMLAATKPKQSWARLFPRGPALFQALGGSLLHPGLLGWVMTWTTADDADRRVFAEFLAEGGADFEPARPARGRRPFCGRGRRLACTGASGAAGRRAAAGRGAGADAAAARPVYGRRPEHGGRAHGRAGAAGGHSQEHRARVSDERGRSDDLACSVERDRGRDQQD